MRAVLVGGAVGWLGVLAATVAGPADFGRLEQALRVALARLARGSIITGSDVTRPCLYDPNR